MFLRIAHHNFINGGESSCNYFSLSSSFEGKKKKKVEENKETELDAIVVFQTSSGLSSLLAKSLSQEHWDMTCMWEEDR